MEAGNNQSNVVGGTGAKEPEKKRKRQTYPLGNDEDIQQQLDTTENSSELAEQMRIVQEKLNSLSAEVGTVKTENQLLAEKNNVLVARLGEVQAQNAEMKARLETLEQKLKVTELETKVANQEMQSSVSEKLTAISDQLWEELCKIVDEKTNEQKQQVDGLTSKLGEENNKMWSLVSDVLHENQQKFDVQETKMADMDKKMEELAKQLDQGMAEFGEKMATLKGQTAEDRNKLEEMRKTLDESNPTKLLWSNNKWHISDQKGVRTTADGLTVTKTIRKNALITIRATRSVSRTLLALIPGQKLIYWEVQMRNNRVSDIGWIGPNVPLNDKKWIGDHPGSFGNDCFGSYWESGRKVKRYGNGFGSGDVLGSGLLFTRDGRFKLFFTLNGALNGEPIVLENNQDLLLFPAVSFSFLWNDTSVEANFGADLAWKPFKFDVNAHEAQLFG